MRDVVNNTGQNISEKTSYFKNGEVISEIKVNDSVKDILKFRYVIDKEKNTFQLSYKNHSKKFIIEKLTKNEFDLKDLETDKIIRNIRVKD